MSKDIYKKTAPVWIISDGRHATGLPPWNETDETDVSTGPFREYAVSELGRYLLNPDPISIHDRLVGCHIRFKPTKAHRIKRVLLRALPVSRSKNTQDDLSREYLSSMNLKTRPFKDSRLEQHFRLINRSLRPYDSLLRMLESINVGAVLDLTGVCEDIAGNRYRLDLQGSVQEKLDYIVGHLLTRVRITMRRAYLSNGLFELRGFSFEHFDPGLSYRLIRFFRNGEPVFRLMDTDDGRPGFEVEDPRLVHALQLFEQSLRTNVPLRESIAMCIRGEAQPFKLFFTKQLEFSYSQNHLPGLFLKNHDIARLNPEHKGAIADILNNRQRVISFNYIPRSSSGEEKMHTHISVMHDVQALEPLKEQFPNLFSELAEQAPASDAGRFYLLDAIRGAQDD
ncbi:hypothetical protein JCM14469_05920 [Desulfatiferula olefinivorans]